MDLHLQLEMPLEALMLPHSAAAAGPLWAWLAVLAAAFGLWRIRSSTSSSSAAAAAKPDDSHRGNPDQNQLQSTSPQPQPEGKERSSLLEALPPAVHVAASDVGCSVSFTRKGTLFEARSCYDEDEGDDRGGNDAVDGEDHDLEVEEEQQQQQQKQKPWVVDGGVVYDLRGVWWGESWRGDLGWYLHQDVAALNGSVVKLWEDEKKPAASRLTRLRGQHAAR